MRTLKVVKIDTKIFILPCSSNVGLGNVRPAGHMRPAKHINVAREHILG